MWNGGSTSMMPEIDKLFSIIRGTYMEVLRTLPISQLGATTLEIQQTGKRLTVACARVPQSPLKEIACLMWTKRDNVNVLYRDVCPE